MNKELLASIFRNFLRAAIGAAVTAGYIQPGVITDQTTMEIGGAIAFCILEWWSHRHKVELKAVAADAATVETKAVAIQAVRDVAATAEGRAVLTAAIQTAVEEKKETK